MDPTSCPDDKIVQLLLLGQLSAVEAEPLEQHIAICPHCAETLGRIDAVDSLVDAMRAPHGPLLASRDREMSQPMILWFKRLLRTRGSAHSALSAASSMSKLSLSLGTAADRTVDFAEAESLTRTSREGINLDFLAPAQDSDEIGRLAPIAC